MSQGRTEQSGRVRRERKSAAAIGPCLRIVLLSNADGQSLKSHARCGLTLEGDSFAQDEKKCKRKSCHGSTGLFIAQPSGLIERKRIKFNLISGVCY